MPFRHAYNFLILLLSLVLMSSTLSGQQMDIKSKYEIRYDDQVLDYREISDKFSFSSEAMEYYTKSLRSYKRAKTTGWVTLGTIGAGVILLNVDDGGRNCSSICVTSAELTGLGLIIIVAPITGVASLITLRKGITRQKKAVAAYNQNGMGFQKGKVKDQIMLGVTQNGVGLVYQF